MSKLSIRWILPAAVVIPVFAVAVVLILLAFKTGQSTANELAGPAFDRSITMRWSSAGDDPPLIFDPQRGLLDNIDPSGSGLPLGVMNNEEYGENLYAELRVGQVML